MAGRDDIIAELEGLSPRKLEELLQFLRNLKRMDDGEVLSLSVENAIAEFWSGPDGDEWRDL